jgi:hypothetical protein
VGAFALLLPSTDVYEIFAEGRDLTNFVAVSEHRNFNVSRDGLRVHEAWFQAEQVKRFSIGVQISLLKSRYFACIELGQTLLCQDAPSNQTKWKPA